MSAMLPFEFFTQSQSQNANSASISRNKVKPWVFRPKKVIYSLEAGNTNNKKFSTSHWNQEENQRYVSFLIKFKEVIEGGKKNRRKWHLNRMMSKAIGTRSHEQCRSHHQKMMKHYKNIQGIIDHFEKTQTENPTSCDNADSNISNCQPSDLPLENQLNIDQEWCWDALEDSVGIRLPLFQEEEPLI